MTELLLAEDLTVGLEIDLGTYTVSGDEIVEFATQWDPQPFHIDHDAAAKGYFGEVIASGAHTLAVFQRLAVLGAYRYWDVVAGRAIREVHLLRPVRAGTELHGTLTVTAVEPNRPDRSLVTKIGRLQEDDAVVMTVEFDAYVRRRAAHRPQV
jgi:acyl dehydratase